MASELLVLDSWPVMEWLKAREPTATKFDELLASAAIGELKLIMSRFNWGEVYYNSYGVWGGIRAEEVLAEFDELPIRIFDPKQSDFLSAARLKARYNCSYADSFAAVLAIEFGAPVVTGDPDFLKLSKADIVSVEWWGK